MAKPIVDKIKESEEDGVDMLHDDLFGEPRKKAGKTRSQWRKENEEWKAKDSMLTNRDLPFGKEELEKLQAEDEDETLVKIGKQADGEIEFTRGEVHKKSWTTVQEETQQWRRRDGPVELTSWMPEKSVACSTHNTVGRTSGLEEQC